ncbi:DUF4232 domain-containing protein [Streptomyces sp. NBC_01213]|uniref:DUF4232 domain-containing protein n=1 Tax=Streptomyces sp. NBC_01213 TaxID=2903776 RepID=UPI00352FAD1F|nr:DUF4232 domain-containing protein [Streptomyces sp. NBC_01213]
MRLQKTYVVVATTATAALALTACSGDDGTGTGAAARSAPASASSASVSASPGAPSATDGSGGPSASTGSGEAAEGSGGGDPQASASAASPSARAPYGGICRTANLSFSSSGGMAEGEVLINLRNTGSSSCSMHGFPGLDLEGEDGTVSAGRSSGRTIPTVALAPGEGTNFALHFPPDTGGGSGVTFTSAMVTPPDETHSHRLSLSVSVPAGTGSGPRITVDPVGSGK